MTRMPGSADPPAPGGLRHTGPITATHANRWES
jgi:hypothetical protein